MPHLASIRRGWEAENLARFLLSQFAFVAHPSSVSDDIGSDFFCTLFRTQKKDNREYLLPRNSFAIQIKSNAKSFDVTNKIEYLSGLEIPFFVGVVDRNDLKLTIYSGEYLPILFSHKEPPVRLRIQLCAWTPFNLDNYCIENGDKDYILRFPSVTEVKADLGPDQLKAVVDTLCEVCSCAIQIIASKMNGEFIFRPYRHESPGGFIFAGGGSAKVFRLNFLKRLIEAFHNFEWIHDNWPWLFSIEEFEVYREFVPKLKAVYSRRAPYLSEEFLALFESFTKDDA